jgi:hypothetical protein
MLDVMAQDAQAPARRPEERGGELKECGLSRAARAEYGDGLAFPDFEGQAAQRGDIAERGPVEMEDVFRGERRH